MVFGTCARVVAAHEAAFGWTVPPVVTHVYPTLAGGLPCGVRNGGGCYQGPGNTLSVRGDPRYGIHPWSLFHELLHLRFWVRDGNVDTGHLSPEWRDVDRWVPTW